MAILDIRAIKTAINTRTALRKIIDNVDVINVILADGFGGGVKSIDIVREGDLRIAGILKGENQLVIKVIDHSVSPAVIQLTVKAGSLAKIINKRVLNELNVWHHRQHRKDLEQADSIIDDDISSINIRTSIDAIGWNDRLFSNTKILSIGKNTKLLNDLVVIEAQVIRSLFNKATVTISVQPMTRTTEMFTTRTVMEKVQAIAPGVIKQFNSHYRHEPVNQYTQAIITNYFKQIK